MGVLQRSSGRWITAGGEAMTATFQRERCAATPEAPPTCAPVCQGLRGTAADVRVRLTDFFSQVFNSFGRISVMAFVTLLYLSNKPGFETHCKQSFCMNSSCLHFYGKPAPHSDFTMRAQTSTKSWACFILEVQLLLMIQTFNCSFLLKMLKNQPLFKTMNRQKTQNSATKQFTV